MEKIRAGDVEDLLPEIPLVRSCHEFNIAGPKQWPHTHALGAMYAGGPV
jgi:hypothetical protein